MLPFQDAKKDGQINPKALPWAGIFSAFSRKIGNAGAISLIYAIFELSDSAFKNMLRK